MSIALVDGADRNGCFEVADVPLLRPVRDFFAVVAAVWRNPLASWLWSIGFEHPKRHVSTIFIDSVILLRVTSEASLDLIMQLQYKSATLVLGCNEN